MSKDFTCFSKKKKKIQTSQRQEQMFRCVYMFRRSILGADFPPCSVKIIHNLLSARWNALEKRIDAATRASLIDHRLRH